MPQLGAVTKVASKTLSSNLLHWFDQHQRDLPWRRTYEPYHVWVSEIMLQQTQVDRVVDYFNRWIRRFPDIATLAGAGEDEVLHAWEGLGYYSRARNLHKTAQKIIADHGTLPTDYKELLDLPGIGPYTAGAIMSIAYNLNYPVVDANIERLFSRLYDIASPIKSKENKAFIWQKAKELLPSGTSRLFNQALMELGALVCLPKKPQCPNCPLSSDCLAYKHDSVHKRPVLPQKKKTIFIEMATGILVKESKVLIQKRQVDDVWANLWEFPGGRLKDGESPKQAVIREFYEETELRIDPHSKITSINHSYMHYRVTLHGFVCTLSGSDQNEPALHAAQQNKWVSWKELQDYAFPAGHRKLIDFIHNQHKQNFNLMEALLK